MGFARKIESIDLRDIFDFYGMNHAKIMFTAIVKIYIQCGNASQNIFKGITEISYIETH